MITSLKAETKYSMAQSGRMNEIEKVAAYGSYQIGSTLFNFAAYLSPPEFEAFNVLCQKIEERVRKSAVEEEQFPTPESGSALRQSGGC